MQPTFSVFLFWKCFWALNRLFECQWWHISLLWRWVGLGKVIKSSSKLSLVNSNALIFVKLSLPQSHIHVIGCLKLAQFCWLCLWDSSVDTFNLKAPSSYISLFHPFYHKSCCDSPKYFVTFPSTLKFSSVWAERWSWQVSRTPPEEWSREAWAPEPQGLMLSKEPRMCTASSSVSIAELGCRLHKFSLHRQDCISICLLSIFTLICTVN